MFLKLAIIVACLVLLYFRILQGLVSDWVRMPDFSHGFLIPIVSLYFVYERRKQCSVLSPSSHWAGLALLLFGVMFYLLGNLATEFFMMRFSLLVVLGGIITTVFDESAEWCLLRIRRPASTDTPLIGEALIEEDLPEGRVRLAATPVGATDPGTIPTEASVVFAGTPPALVDLIPHEPRTEMDALRSASLRYDS